MNNMNDATKVWIHREFSVDPSRDYDVDLAYDFASADWGGANLFALLAGASPTPPTTGPEVLSVARTGQRTGNGAAFDVGYLWSRKEFGLQARSSAVGKLYVLVGVWGTWETSRTHYIDNVTVRLTPR